MGPEDSFSTFATRAFTKVSQSFLACRCRQLTLSEVFQPWPNLAEFNLFFEYARTLETAQFILKDWFGGVESATYSNRKLYQM